MSSIPVKRTAKWSAPALARPGESEARWAVVALAVSMAAAAGLVLALTHGDTLSSDELKFLLDREGYSPDVFLRPNNEHIMVAPFVLYKGLFEIFGVAAYWPYRLAVVALHLLCAGLLFALARRRAGDPLALVAAVMLLFLGAAWEVVLQLALLVFLLPLAGGLGMLLALERGDRKGDYLASGCLLLALASGSLGVVFAIAATVEILFGDDRVGRLLRVLAVPVALYVLWQIQYGDSSRFVEEYLSVPEIVARYVAGTLAALVGLDYQSAPAVWFALALAGAVAVVAAILRRREGWQRVLSVLVMALSYWVLIAVFRPASDEIASRYVYPGGVFLLLLAVGTIGRRRLGPRAIAVVGVAVALVIASQIGEFRSGAERLRDHADFVSAGLGALELARDTVDPSFVPEPTRAPDVVAGRYFAAVDAHGSPGDDPREIADRPEDARRAADIVSTRALRVALAPAELPRRSVPALAVTHGPGRSVPGRAGCLAFDLRRSGSAELSLPPTGVAIDASQAAPVRLRLRRFAAGYGPDDAAPGEELFPLRFFYPPLLPLVLEVEGGRTAALRVPSDRASARWYVRMTSPGPVLACALPR